MRIYQISAKIEAEDCIDKIKFKILLNQLLNCDKGISLNVEQAKIRLIKIEKNK